MRASELTIIFEAEGDRTYWYLSGESYPGHYMGGIGGYRSYIMPANAKSVHTRKELTPMVFDPQTCVFTNPANGKQYIAYSHDNYDGQDISKLLITPYPIPVKMQKPLNYPPNDGTPYDANEEVRQKAEAFKPTVLEIWHELQTENWAKIDAKLAAYKAKQDAKHPLDLNKIRFNDATGKTLLAVAADPNKVFRSDELYFGNGGTMGIAFHKLQGLGYVELGKKGSYTTVRITPSGVEAAKYLQSVSGTQEQTKLDNVQKKILRALKSGGNSMDMAITYDSNKIDPNNVYGKQALEWVQANQDVIFDYFRNEKVYSFTADRIAAGLKRLGLVIPRDLRNKLIQTKMS